MTLRFADRRAGLSRLALSLVLLCGAAVLGSGVLDGPADRAADRADPGRIVPENVLTQGCTLTQRSSTVGRLGCARLSGMDGGITARFLSAAGG